MASRKFARILARLLQVLSLVQSTVLWLGSFVLILWLVSPVRAWLQAHGLVNGEFVVALVGLTMIFYMKAFQELNSRIAATASPLEERVVLGGVAKVYPYLESICEAAAGQRNSRPKRHLSLEVLGLTLFTAWPRVRGFIEEKQFDNWQFRMYCLDPDFIRAQAGLIPARWANEVDNKIADIAEFARERQDELRSRGISLQLVTYAHFPALHGFRIREQEVLCSFIQWADGHLNDPYQFYEHYSAADTSERAARFRDLFGNWLDAAATGTILLPEPGAGRQITEPGIG